MPSGLVDEARRSGGAIFPDGFAVLADDPNPADIVVHPIEIDSEPARVAEEVETQHATLDHHTLQGQSYVERDQDPQFLQIQIRE